LVFDLAEALGKTAREIERMPAGEFMEWTGRLKDTPWGRYRTEHLHLQLLMFLAAGPSPKMIDMVKLPWIKGKAENIKEVSAEEMRAFLMSIGGKPSGG